MFKTQLLFETNTQHCEKNYTKGPNLKYSIKYMTKKTKLPVLVHSYTNNCRNIILYIYHMPSHAISILSPTRLAEFAKVSIFPEACRGLYRHFQSRGLPSFENVDIAWEGMWLMFYHTFFWAKFGLESRIWSNVGYESHQSKTRHVERIYVYIVQAINSSH